jgi:hypothetical protein
MLDSFMYTLTRVFSINILCDKIVLENTLMLIINKIVSSCFRMHRHGKTARYHLDAEYREKCLAYKRKNKQEAVK